MSTWGRTDTDGNKPKFSFERQVRTTIRLVANANTNIVATNTTLFFANTSQLSVGMYVSGNNVNVTANTPGFFASNVTITQVNGANVKISKVLTANVNSGDIFRFDTEIPYTANTTEDLYNTDTYLVSATRKANTYGYANNVASTGWVNVKQGRGFVANLSVANANSGLTYANAYLSIVGDNITPANAQIIVIGTSNVTVQLNGTGSGYTFTPTISASGANNSGLQFTVTPGGRMNRVQCETLVAMANSQTTNVNSGGRYFPGV